MLLAPRLRTRCASRTIHGQNKLFMANYEALRRRQNFQSVYSVPTAAMFNGDFSGLTTIYDPNTKEPFPGNVIPANRLDLVSKKLEQYYARPTYPEPVSPTISYARMHRRGTATASCCAWISWNRTSRSSRAGIVCGSRRRAIFSRARPS
jgi:hypothetical protein